MLLTHSLLQYEVAVITSEGADIQGPFELDTKWDIAHYVRYMCMHIYMYKHVKYNISGCHRYTVRRPGFWLIEGPDTPKCLWVLLMGFV